MTQATNPSAPARGVFRRALAASWAFLQRMESGSAGYTFDRIERLEREVGRLQEELRKSRNSGAVDVHSPSAATLER